MIDTSIKVKVFNDTVLVYEGTIKQFIEDNENDEAAIDFCNELQTKNEHKINLFHSGKWRIIKID